MWGPEEIERVVGILAEQLGKPYALGGPGEHGWVVRGKPDISDAEPADFDCSGLSRWSIGQGTCVNGEKVILPHGTIPQVKFCIPISRPPKPLELGFADLDCSGQVDHVVIAKNAAMVIEARGRPFYKVIERPISKWEAQKGFLGWWSPPGIYLRRGE